MMFKAGDRIELVAMPDDPAPIEPGTRGTIVRATEHSWGKENFVQLTVNWDNGRNLHPCIPPDVVRVIKGEEDEQTGEPAPAC